MQSKASMGKEPLDAGSSSMQEQFNALVQRYWQMKSEGAKPEQLAPLQKKLEEMSSKDSSLIGTIQQGLNSAEGGMPVDEEEDEMAGRPAPVGGY